MNHVRHLESSSPQWGIAAEIVRRLRAAGHESFIVGGAVRDALLGRKPKDVDVATSAHPDAIVEMFGNADLVGASFGVVIVKLDGESIEVATFRQDGAYSDGRRPDSVEFCNSAAEDAKRRDFTINALFYDPVAGVVVDHVGGMEDLEAGVIRAVGNPVERFNEDHLRMLRAVRFAMRYGFAIDGNTAEAICRGAHLLGNIAQERIAMELDAIFRGRNAGRAMHMLSALGIMRVVLPEVDQMHGVEQPPDWHPEGDVFVHTALAMDKLSAPSSALAWSVLLHDVGKRDTFKVDETGRIRFSGHDDVGAVIARSILGRLKMPNDVIETVAETILQHNKLHYTKEMRKATLRRIIGKADFPVFLELNRVDSMSSAQITEGYVHMLDFIVKQDGRLKMPEPLVNGRDLINLGYTPVPAFGKVLHEVYDMQLEGALTDREAAIEQLKLLMEVRP